MAGLKNIFTWSISTGNDFELCRRRHYWKKYGSWNGWDKSSSDEAKKAYLLKNMQVLKPKRLLPIHMKIQHFQLTHLLIMI